ncbi:MAG: FHA domain-containing protein [Actinomycetota bacterium]|nr:FHA domain-containing protein [Actinomycetota bacterium]MDQ2955459.1 FHA domain-containing protein [Actinomycetota bacterium]
MSLAQRFERRLEGMVGSAFARVFKGQVEPVEIGNALQREAMDKKAVMGNGQVLAPNRYRVTLGNSDYERLAPWEAQLTLSLAELVQEYLDEHRLATIGDIEVYLAKDEALHTGVFGVASRMEPQAPPRRRPMDSMSMPVVKDHPEEYVQPFAVPVQPPAMQQPPVQQPPVQPPYVEPPRRPSYRAQLVVDGTPRSVELTAGSNVIGRGVDSDLQVMDQGVSRRHADVHIVDGHATVYDLGSTNGTSVNGRTVQSQQLQHGDVIRVGHTRLVFHEDSS